MVGGVVLAVMAMSERHLLPGCLTNNIIRLITLTVSRSYVLARISRMTELRNECKPMMSATKFRRDAREDS